MSSPLYRRALIVCDDAAVPPIWNRQSWTDRETIHASTSLARRPPDTPINLVIQGLKHGLLAERSDRTDDLIRIGAYVYRADQLISRGSNTDAHDEQWEREFALCIPVIDVAFWSRADVSKVLVDALYFATGDIWHFAFCLAASTVREHIATQQRLDGLPRADKPGCVVLFSGGLDSLCALIEARNRGERPMAVGHWSAPPINSRQLRLIADLAKTPTGLRPIPLIGAWIHGYGYEAKERTRRARGFLFACLAGAVAGELEVAKIYFADNGPISLNLPINDQITGAHVSRSTHPVFLATITELLRLVYPSAPTVSNPLEFQTRAECVQAIVSSGYASLLPETSSCADWGRLPAATPQCGVCSQCIDRRFAMIAAGLTAFDPVDRYKFDLFRDHLSDWQAQMLVRSYVRFAQRLVHYTRDELLAEFPQLYEAILPDDPHPDDTLDAYVDLIRRHARNVVDAFTKELTAAIPEIAGGALLSTSLLLTAGFTIESNQSHPTNEADVPLIVRSFSSRNPHVGSVNSLSEVECVFCFDGDKWNMRYDGRSVRITDHVGFVRIAYLLDHPRSEYTAGEILIATDPAMRSAVWSASTENSEGLLLLSYEDGGLKGDSMYKRQLRSQIHEVLEELDDARDIGDQLRIAELNVKMEDLTKTVGELWGLGGRSRGFGNPVTQQRETVKRSINRGIALILTKHPTLAQHLKGTLKRSNIFVYMPDRAISWRIELPDLAA